MSKLFRSFRASYRSQSLWLRLSQWLLLAYFIYALILGLLTPYILAQKLPALLSQTLGRQVTIEKININPFLLRVRITDFHIAEADGNDNFFRFKQLELDAGFWRTLLTFTPTVEHFYLNGPYVQLSRLQDGDNTTFNFSDIIRQLQSQSGSTEDKEPDNNSENSIPHIRLGLLKLTDGEIKIYDDVTRAELDYPDLEFELENLDTYADIPTTPQSQENAPDNYYQIELTTSAGGSLHLDGLFQLSPLALTGEVALKQIALPPLWPLSNDIIEAKLTNGLVDFYVGYQVSETADGFRFKANNGQLTLSSIALSDSDAERITLNSMKVNNVKLDTDTQQVDIQSIEIIAPFVSGIYDSDGLDLVHLLTPKGSTSSASEPASSTAPESAPDWHVVLGKFSLTEGDIQLQEQAIADSMNWRVKPLTVSTGKINTRFITPIDYEVALSISGDSQAMPDSAQGEITTHGSADVANRRVDGKFAISDVVLSQTQAYLTPYVNLSLSEGKLSATGTYQAGGSDNQMMLSGDGTITDLTVLDGLHNEPLLAWQNLAVHGIHFNSKDNQFDVATVTVEQPYAKILIDEQKRTNIGDIIRDNKTANGEESAADSTQPATEDAADSATPMTVNIAAVKINNGSAYFADKSLTPQFASSIESLNGSIEALSSDPGTAATLAINGKIDSYAPVALQGEINPLLDELFLDLNFSVDGAELTSVNPYSGTYMGYYIDKGLLSLDVKYKIKNNELDGDNHVVIDQLTLGRKTDSEQALNLPLGLAVALLQDNDGVIDLGLEVTGDLDNPDFNFGSIILSALGNLITKAVTAPFSFLASLVGSDDELKQVRFNAGQHRLNDDGKSRLATLAQALNKRPGLRLSIEGMVNAVTDARELAIDQLHQTLQQRSELTSLPADLSASNVPLEGPLASALETLFFEQFEETREVQRQQLIEQLQKNSDEPPTEEQIIRAMHISMYNRLRDAISISKDQLAELAHQRGKAVKGYLANQAKVDASRLFLLNSQHHLQSQMSAVELSIQAN